jgi:acyl-CoA thioesterase
MSETNVRERLLRAIEVLDHAQRQRLLDWAGSINRAAVDNPRAPGASIGPLAEYLQIENAGTRDGRAVYTLRVTPLLLNPHGVLHGGAIYTMVDYSMGGATMSVLPPGEICATIEIKINYLAGVREGTLRSETEIIKRGRTVVFLESRVKDGAGKLVATASGSFAIIRQGDRQQER